MATQYSVHPFNCFINWSFTLAYLSFQESWVHFVCQETPVIYKEAHVLSLLATFTLLYRSKFAPAPGSLKNFHANCKMHSEPHWLFPSQRAHMADYRQTARQKLSQADVSVQ